MKMSLSFLLGKEQENDGKGVVFDVNSRGKVTSISYFLTGNPISWDDEIEWIRRRKLAEVLI